MASVIIPVLLCLLLGPGVGQLYNKEYKKGALFIVLSAVVLGWAMVWYWKAIHQYLPGDLSAVDPQALPQILKNASDQVSAQGGRVLVFFKAALTALWLYGAIDAYLVADQKRTRGGP